jgi:hypothetical protein
MDNVKKASTQNENCLAGLRCPRCGSTEPLDISGRGIFQMYDDGVSSCHSVSWDDDSLCTCPGCNHCAPVAEFRIGATTDIILTFEDGTTLEMAVEYSSPLAVSSIWDVHSRTEGE